MADGSYPATPERLSKRVAVIMQRRLLQSRWQSEAWEPVGVLPDYAGEAGARVIVDEGGTTQWLHPGFEVLVEAGTAEAPCRKS